MLRDYWVSTSKAPLVPKSMPLHVSVNIATLCYAGRPSWSGQLAVTYADAMKDIAHHAEQQWVQQNNGKASEKGAVCLLCDELKTGEHTL